MEMRGLETYWLSCHPDTPGKAIKAISAKVSHPTPEHVAVFFMLYGVVADLVWPNRREQTRTDELWKSTCLEVFIRGTGDGYREYNFSPSGAWAAYDFQGYREGMRKPDFARMPEVYDRSSDGDECLLTVRIAVEPVLTGKIALSAVIEERDGTKSYWALAHPPGQPDFHHPACFAATLAAPNAS
jgi:hypothetical protein